MGDVDLNDTWVRSARKYVTVVEECECDCILCNPLADLGHCDYCPGNAELEVPRETDYCG